MPARKPCDRRDRSKAGRRGLVVTEIVGFGAQVNQEPGQILRKEIWIRAGNCGESPYWGAGGGGRKGS